MQRLTFLVFLALCVYLSEAGYKSSEERWDDGRKYNKKNEKYDKYKKYDKYDKYDKKQEKYDRHYERGFDSSRESFGSDESNEIEQRRDHAPRYDDQRYRGGERYYEKEYKPKYNKYYEGERKYEKKPEKKHYQQQYDYHPEGGFYDETVQFSKRRLFSVPEDDDHFFDDVRQYEKKHQQHDRHQQRKPQHHQGYHQQDRYWQQQEPERYQRYPEQRYNERYPGGEGNFREYGGPSTRYSWKQDREDFPRMKALDIPPPERPHKGFVPTADNADPPAPSEAAKMARYIVHNSDWTTVATISTLPHIRQYPFVNVLSVSDGPIGKGSGIPYLYMTELDMTPHDLAVNRRCSISMSLAETDYCKQQSLDPEDPRCAHITLTGEMWKLRNGTQAAKLAEEALFTRHPVMKNWPKDHNFFFATLKIEQIILLDYFGGPKFVDVKDYLRATPST